MTPWILGGRAALALVLLALSPLVLAPAADAVVAPDPAGDVAGVQAGVQHRTGSAERRSAVVVERSCQTGAKSIFCVRLLRNGSRWWASASIRARRYHASTYQPVKIDWVRLHRYSCSSKRWLVVRSAGGSAYYSRDDADLRTARFDYDEGPTRWYANARFDSENYGWHAQKTAVAGRC